MADRQRGNDPGETARRVAANVKRYRTDLGLTTQQLADRLTDLGQRFSRDGIMKLETGARRVDVDDLTVLALALEVSPLTLLLLPADTDNPVVLAPKEPGRDFRRVWLWGTGERPLEWTDKAAELLFIQRSDPIRWARLLEEIADSPAYMARRASSMPERADVLVDAVGRSHERQARLAAEAEYRDRNGAERSDEDA